MASSNNKTDSAAVFAQRLNEVRRTRKLSQDELGARIGILGKVLGRYERGEARPLVEVAAALARALDVSLDYLSGVTNEELDRSTAERILAAQKLNSEDRAHVFAIFDPFITRRRLEAII